MTQLRKDALSVKRLLKVIQNPRTSQARLKRVGNELTDLTTDVRVIIAIQRRMLARSR